MPDYEWSADERHAIREQGRGTEHGWDGRCKLWGAGNGCRKGKTCRDSKAEPWTPVSMPSPKFRPAGVRVEDRRICSCPERLPARIWSAVRRWQDARRGNGLPEPGHVTEQPAWLLSAFGVLDGEWSLIELSMQEEQQKRLGG